MTIHRVCMYRDQVTVTAVYNVYDDDATVTGEEDSVLACIKRFSKTREAAWANQQDIRLHHCTDKLTYAYAIGVEVYADLTDKQYTDYVLRGLYIE